MNSPDKANSLINLRKPTIILSAWIFALLLLGLTFKSVLEEMVGIWISVEEYSHGFFIPVISVYFLWLRRKELKFVDNFKDSLPGLLITVFGLLLLLMGTLATARVVELYSFIVTLTGVFAIAFGTQGLRLGAIPLLFLIFMVPIPAVILNNLSSKLQLISSWLGVEFIRACDIMVHLDGNVIDLGIYKLQVVDACSGLRYLFPLASLSFLCAYLFKGPFWQKVLLFLSSAPLTIFMNSFRIGVIGILVDNWGTEMAEGFLHDFEGWIIFLFCMALLFVEMWLFSRLSGKKLPFNELVLIPSEWSDNTEQKELEIKFNKTIFVLLLLLFTTAITSNYIKGREEIIPSRQAFLNFPLQLGPWQGRNDYLSQFYLDQLKLTDYVIINYAAPESASSVNFYSAYYQSQRQGASIHSPKACMPGDGWKIAQFGQQSFPDITVDGNALEFNRAVIEKGDSKQLVYYWFQHHGRTITNEYLEKWYLFYDAITMNRSDGALVRLVTNVGTTENIEVADQRLKSFIKQLMPQLPTYIPGKSVTE